jgi:hypothetical protein
MVMSFANVPLLLEDPEGSAKRHIRRFLDERLASIFCETPIAINEGRNAGRFNNGQSSIAHVGLPVPNYPPCPTPRINSLYWPTGASRFSHGLFLINGANLSSILTACGNNNTPQSFKMGTIENAAYAPIDTQMYLLPPRPVSPPGVAANDRLWLLPIVDERYFWQYRTVTIFNPRTTPSFSPTSWTDCFTQLATYLGIAMSWDAVPGGYGVPEATEWKRDGENAAMLLDAAAHTVGMRVVRDWSGATRVCQYATATADYATNLTTFAPSAVAGGDFSTQAVGSVVPEAIEIAFRSDDGSKIGGYLGYANPGSIFEPTRVKTFFSTIKYSNDGSVSLVLQAATDYWGWLTTRYDYDWAGIVPWSLTGYDDFVLWEFGVPKPGGMVAQTRVQSYPYNFGICNLPVDAPSSSSSASSGSSASSHSGGSTVSGSSSASGACGCITVVTGVSCSGSSLSVTYGSARGCC